MISLAPAAPARTCLLTPAMMLRGYERGRFPMTVGPHAPDRYVWRCPWSRGILPLDRFHVSRKLRSLIRKDRFEITVDAAFREVVEACAEPSERRPGTWIAGGIREVFGLLYDQGYSHSVEAWRGGSLVGGVFGTQIGAAWFGESMFTRESNAGKVAFAHLNVRLLAGGFTLCDVQWATRHMRSFGAVEINHLRYRWRLARATRAAADFHALPGPPSGRGIVDLLEHARAA